MFKFRVYWVLAFRAFGPGILGFLAASGLHLGECLEERGERVTGGSGKPAGQKGPT